jgi:hypothetical protein
MIVTFRRPGQERLPSSRWHRELYDRHADAKLINMKR